MGSDDSFVILKNPADNGVIELKVSRNGVLILYASDGRLVYRKQVVSGIVSISVKEFTKGIYFIRSNGRTKKIILK